LHERCLDHPVQHPAAQNAGSHDRRNGRRRATIDVPALQLLDDRLCPLVHALRAKRRIDDTIRKSMRYVSAVHVPIAVPALLPPQAFCWRSSWQRSACSV
jgi:hypothetical protein